MSRRVVAFAVVSLAVLCPGAAVAGAAADAGLPAASIDFSDDVEPVDPIVVDRGEKKEFRPLLPERYRRRPEHPPRTKKKRGCGACNMNAGSPLGPLGGLLVACGWLRLTPGRRR